MNFNLRRKSLWIAVFSLIIFVLKTYFEIEIPKGDFLIESILLIATLLGVFDGDTNTNKEA